MQARNTTKNIVLCGLFTALIIAGGFIKIPLPYVPCTLQLFFTNLAALFLGKKYGTLSVAVYLLLGLVGVPIFAYGGGFGYVFNPTFGYIIGFVIGAFAAGLIANKKLPSFKIGLAAGTVNLLFVYACGIAYFYLISTLYLGKAVPFRTLLINCFLITVGGDFIGIILSALLMKRLALLLKKG